MFKVELKTFFFFWSIIIPSVRPHSHFCMVGASVSAHNFDWAICTRLVCCTWGSPHSFHWLPYVSFVVWEQACAPFRATAQFLKLVFCDNRSRIASCLGGGEPLKNGTQKHVIHSAANWDCEQNRCDSPCNPKSQDMNGAWRAFVRQQETGSEETWYHLLTVCF